jgi:hypothetical protein
VDTLRKLRRDLRNGIVMMNPCILPFSLRGCNKPYTFGSL